MNTQAPVQERIKVWLRGWFKNWALCPADPPVYWSSEHSRLLRVMWWVHREEAVRVEYKMHYAHKFFGGRLVRVGREIGSLR